VEVPPKVEYSYSGKMKLIGISKPRWFSGNDRYTRWNPDVIQGDFPLPANGAVTPSWKIYGKSTINKYLEFNRRVWRKLPRSLYTRGPVRLYGDLAHMLARKYGPRAQAPSTFFLRNRPQLELIRRLAEKSARNDTLKLTVLGCSTGVEAYSIAWVIRSARPDLKLVLHAVDISRRAVEFAKFGKYSLVGQEVTDTNVFERMTEAEITQMFDREGNVVTVKPWIKEGIHWQIGDAGKRETIDSLGPQDFVVANNFLCHMYPLMAERCLRNIARLVRPNGYLFVSGIDLDVRTKVAGDLGWYPLQELLDEIHMGDPCMETYWPWHYAGLEPLNKRRADWRLRYAAAFRLGSSPDPVGEPVRRYISAEAT